MKARVTLLLAALAVACGKDGGEGILPSSAPSVPQNVQLHSATETSLTFQWGLVDGASSYGWQLLLEGVECQAGSVSTRNVTIKGLSKGTAYTFSVCAKGAGGVSAYSAAIEGKTEGVAPPPGGIRVCVDAPLVLELDSPPVLGTSGQVRIFRSDGTQVDLIDLADIATVNVREDGVMVPKEQLVNPSASSSTFLDALPSGGKSRVVSYTPFYIKGNCLEIRPHCAALDFDTAYYVTVDAAVCGKAVAAGEWTFTTSAAPSVQSLRVATDGSADFCTLQRALSYAADGATITLAPGTYPELLYLRDRKNLTVRGDARDAVRIAYPNSETYMNGSSARCLWLVENCDNLVLEHLTIENTFGNPKGQAECLYFNSGSNAHRLTIADCALLSWQDTFLCKGEVWVHDSLVAGHCDFIWGYPKACLFEACEIRSRAAGYMVQARVPSASDKGFVFLNCHLTAESGVKDGSMYLARSAGQADCFDNVTFVNCDMSPVIAPVGWYASPAPNPSTPTATAGWKEYGTTGAGASSRNSYGKALTAQEAEAYSSKAAVLGW